MNDDLKTPSQLYKYRGFIDGNKVHNNRIFEILETDNFYLSSARGQNDQFECVINYDFARRIREDMNLRLEYILNMVEVISKKLPGNLDQKKRYAEMLRKICRPEGIDRNKSRMMFKSIAPKISNDKIDMAIDRIEQLSSDETIFKGLDDPAKNFLNYTRDNCEKVGILSMSEINNSPVMWAMYSNNCNGICIEVEPKQEKLLKVNYKNKRESDFLSIVLKTFINIYYLKVFNLSNAEKKMNNYFEQLFITKPSDWKFEKEWRIIGDSDTFHSFGKITRVYIGNKISNEYLNKVLEICNRRNIPVQYLVNDYEKMKIKFVDSLK